MKKKNESSAPTEPDKKKNKKGKNKTVKEGRSGMGKYSMRLLLSAGSVMILTCCVLAWLQFGQAKLSNQKQLANAHAEQQSHKVMVRLRNAEQQIQALSESRKLLEAFSDEQKLQDAQVLLSNALPHTNIKLIGPEENIATQKVSFTARTMIEKARRGESPSAAILPTEGAPVLLIARAIGTQGGVIFMTQNLIMLAHELALLDSNYGTTVVTQNISGRSKEIFNSDKGQQSKVSATVTAREGVEVTFFYNTRQDDASTLIYLFTLIAVGGTLVLLALLWFICRNIDTALRRDSALLVHFAEDITQKANATPRGHFSFQSLYLVTNSLVQLSQNTNDRASKSNAFEAQANPPSEAELTGISFEEEDDEVTQISESVPVETEINEPATPVPTGTDVPANIFRQYDIRGIVDQTLTCETMELIGMAIGTEALEAGQQTIIVARDGRLSGPKLSEALIRGITASGRDVIDIGMAPTPTLYYATHKLDSQSGVCLTGSHNPSNYNGVKIVIAGKTLSGEGIQQLRERIVQGKLSQGSGQVSTQEMGDDYIGAIEMDIALARPMKVAIDCGNGITGKLAPRLFETLGCEVIPLFTDVDGNFPNHHPDPGKPENLTQLIETVQQQQADIGIAFDGDGDRLGIVTPAGEIIWPDRLMMLYAKDVLSRSPGADIIFDVKCSRALARFISSNGGRPVMWKTGHSLIKAKMKETGAPLAGEMSGHIFFADRWFGFDDGLYSAARLLEILSLEASSLDQLFNEYQTGQATPELAIETTDEAKFSIIEKLQDSASFANGQVTSIDGLRVDFEDGWGLIRASNTTPTLVARFEGNDQAALERIQQEFRQQLSSVDNSLDIPF